MRKKDISFESIVKLKQEGKSIIEIAKILGCSKQNIYNRLSKKIVNHESIISQSRVNQQSIISQSANNQQLILNQLNSQSSVNHESIIGQSSSQSRVNHESIIKEILSNQLFIEMVNQIVNHVVNQIVNQNDCCSILYNKIDNISNTDNISNKEKERKRINTNKEREKRENIIKEKKEKEIEIQTSNEIVKIKIPQKIKEPQPAIQLIFDFANLIGIENVDSGFIKKNIKYAYQLLKEHEYNEILGLVNWINNNSEFWAGKVKNLGIVYGHFAEWTLEFKKAQENKHLTIKQWLAKHPEYIPKSEKGTVERYRELLRAFNLALKDKNVIPTQEEWLKYREYREKLFYKLKEV